MCVLLEAGFCTLWRCSRAYGLMQGVARAVPLISICDFSLPSLLEPGFSRPTWLTEGQVPYTTCMGEIWKAIVTEPMRLSRFLAQNNVSSRRQAETLMQQGRVRVNNMVVLEQITVESGACVQVEMPDREAVYVLHKPIGVVSSQPEHGHIPAARLLTHENLHRFSIDGRFDSVPRISESLPSLGRLDQDSSGLLLLGRDGLLAKALIGADSAILKTYFVRISPSQISDSALETLRNGSLELDGRLLRPALVNRIQKDGNPNHALQFRLNEGRKRQIRRMLDLVGHRVISLHRSAIGKLKLGNLPLGKFRILKSEERDDLIRSSVSKAQ